MRDLDLQTGIIETFHKDKMSGKITIHKEQDVAPFLQANQKEFNAQSGNFKGHWHKMATIPPIVLEMWREEMKAKGFDDCNPLSVKNRKFLMSKLNSPDWNKLRTKQGII